MCSHDDDEGRYEGRMKGRIRRKMRRKDERKKGDQGWKEGDMLRLEEGKGMANTNPGPQAAFAVPRGLVWQTKPVLVFRRDLEHGSAGDTHRSDVSYVWMMREAM